MTAIQNFDKALLFAYGADPHTEVHYWRTLLVIYRSLPKKNLKQANSSLNAFISRLNDESKLKFIHIAETMNMNIK